ncbi:thiol-disulfide oxidoreductase DCC family protein [Litorilituus sediminis]|uniref:DUF393 domain-containing protein n=1 Tax=Litorilituus sediminis TaxID=718192 RepID=A0A4P6P6V5_9GAMM|nr:DUF393 domain-containing protein [Litorilituus sediminis]QBG37234.1 DUF393 domain-containing protein [Litorilituus sediminis]
MKTKPEKLTVFYDGACPKCVKDRRFYQRLAGKGGELVDWLDINGKDNLLVSLGIAPEKALTELHIQLANGEIQSELDAYITLMKRVWLLKPIAWIIALPFIRPYLAKLYHQRVLKRLKAAGRL